MLSTIKPEKTMSKAHAGEYRLDRDAVLSMTHA